MLAGEVIVTIRPRLWPKKAATENGKKIRASPFPIFERRRNKSWKIFSGGSRIVRSNKLDRLRMRQLDGPSDMLLLSTQQ
jgi:hypothetical protein